MSSILNYATEILLLVFLIITFVQSGIDKVINWQGNLDWLKGHFAKTPLKKIVPLLLVIVLITEVISGVLCLLGVYQILTMADVTLARYGAIFSCIALLMLLFGQRMAQDYEGAKTIAIYFIPAIFLVYMLQP
ncbi:DoxX family membrane protein [Maribacter sp. CXY002]|uniref:DoxX family membrane protein n=1 Tax=Maribacter luteocoastalis TaxID=3407671 RepID=UPI003B66BE3C